MLGLIRQARHGCFGGSGIARLADILITADASAAAALASLQQSAHKASLTQMLANLRPFDPAAPSRARFSNASAAASQPSQRCGCSSSVACTCSGSVPWSGSSGFSTTAARPQDDAAGPAAAAMPPAGVNPLQALPGTNPLSALPVAQDAGPPRDRIARAVLRNARISPQKLNDFAAVIRNLHVDEAMVQCQISVKKASNLVYKLLEGAKANGTNNHGLDGSRLFVEHAIVNKAKMVKRTAIHGRGRSGVLHKRRSHMTVILRELETSQRAPRHVTRTHRPLLQRGRKGDSGRSA